MSSKMRAIETTGTVDDQCQLHLDNPLPIVGPSRVRVIVLFPDESDESDEWDETEWLKAASINPAFDFLKDPAEDIYALEDGKPFNDKG